MTEQVLTFYLGGNLLGINVRLIKEINRNVEYTPVPDAPRHILGLFNMRGQVVTLFDLARILGLKGGNERGRITCIVLKEPCDPDQVGFFIDRPGDVIDVDREECEPPPANVGGVEGEFIKYVVKLDGELLIVIEPDKIFGSNNG
jgi:purine-binding chemotaxis protein CheW